MQDDEPIPAKPELADWRPWVNWGGIYDEAGQSVIMKEAATAEAEEAPTWGKLPFGPAHLGMTGIPTVLPTISSHSHGFRIAGTAGA
ncbi:hypothetical protein [Roseomonas alba]|nr:hypothetical protein [Neoroseomonas alba]